MSQEKLLRFCRARGIQLTAYSPLGSPARLDAKAKQSAHLMEDPLVVRLAKKYQRPAAHILIAYQLRRGICVIPKAIQPAHIRTNFEALALADSLGPEDMGKLGQLNRNHRFMLFERCLTHKYYPFKDEY